MRKALLLSGLLSILTNLPSAARCESQAGNASIEKPAPNSEAAVLERSVKIDSLAEVDSRTEPPVIITDPGAEFQDDARPGAMIIGMDRTPRGRIWGCWTGTGDKRDGYFVLATSDDDGGTWSNPRLVVGAPDPSGKRTRAALVGNLWTDPLGRLWLFFDQTVVGASGPTGNWYIRCDDPDAAAPAWSEPVCFAPGRTLNKPTVLSNGPKPILYNGIELPLEWPPRHLDPDSTEPMPVPYLTNPPRTIPIDVGRQLLVDDFLIGNTTLTRTFHQAEKFEGNPVFKAETKRELAGSDEGEIGEEATVFTGQGGVFWDPADAQFKMFYVAGWRGPLSMATSTDMVHWQRPDLGLAGGNALLPQGLKWTGPELKTGGSDNCVWLDLNATNPAERLKFITCWMHVPKEQRSKDFFHSLHVSDGKTWSDAVPTTMTAGDYSSFFYNPFREKWCFSIKGETSRGRSRYYLESDEFLQGADWDKAVFWTAADRLDAPEPEGGYPGAGNVPQLYSLNAVAYESLMIGMHYIHRGPYNSVCDKGKFPKLIDLELGFSRDGFHWDRPDRSGFIKASRVEGSWDRGYLHSTAGVFVVLDDKLVFPYMGTSGIAPSGHRGMYTGGSIGLATLRRDGFASMDGSGELTTRPVQFSGKHLFVNAIGDLRVEVIHNNGGKVLATSKSTSGDHTRQRIEWNGAADLSQFSGKPVRFRFHLKDGALYAFWVTPDENGASNGYVGAGGPAFDGVHDAIPTP